MGTKGRDVCLWLFFSLAPITFVKGVARYAALMAMFCLALYLYYSLLYLPGALRRSREMGLNMAVLLPLNGSWASLMLWLDKERMDFHGAYEVHIRKVEKHALGEYLKHFTSDLEIVQRTFPGAVFMWETSAPLPLFVRKLVRQGFTDGSAFLKRGCWPVPRFPFTGTDLKRGRVRHGAIVWKEGACSLEVIS
jgi:hypothetical protein